VTAWVVRLFRRRTDAHGPEPELPDSPATLMARAATEQMAATEHRINDAIATLRERERQEELRRIRRTGNFAEGWLVPDRRREES
jgi:hypothetical protein